LVQSFLDNALHVRIAMNASSVWALSFNENREYEIILSKLHLETDRKKWVVN
jgi:hypothetical protein